MGIRPIEIARKLGITTSALRHYESWGIVPPAKRLPNGYRVYTEVHEAYFTCLRTLLPGFGMDVAKEMLLHVRAGELTAALWALNESQAALAEDKRFAERTIHLLETDVLHHLEANDQKQWGSIGEVAEDTGVATSAIRHWEREGLLELPRNEENGYRIIENTHVRKILLIRTLRLTGQPLATIQHLLSEVDVDHIENASKIARESILFLDRMILHQLKGSAAVLALAKVLGLVDS
ncbi:MerR family transcriptional regulator [Aureibacillus halotolerans]|uniref:DNA-binding transcriptional MerR regulator n=1 Tax=Aureibacillus halotolerans TaxID=1508390 RepID=A0A4R6UIL3_9BACI|nr:MerR family transcriptional regulator [Aureibacillus halotolerans]TDQ43014.1 DNA-binding transcriptional MerR regulator [Aureibacillus halotolerans]